jgi:hypothetical protein
MSTCHEHNHLFHDCPLNPHSPVTNPPPSQDIEGFMQVSSRKKSRCNPNPPLPQKYFASHNFFENLPQDNKGNPSLTKENIPPSSTPLENPPTEEQEKWCKMMDPTNISNQEGDVNMQEEQIKLLDSDDGEDMDLGDLYLKSIATAYKQHDPNSIPEKQVHLLKDALVRNWILSGPKVKGMTHTPSLGINPSPSSSYKNLKEEKKRGRKSNKQLIKDLDEFLVNSGHISLMMDKFQPNPPPSLWKSSPGT